MVCVLFLTWAEQSCHPGSLLGCQGSCFHPCPSLHWSSIQTSWSRHYPKTYPQSPTGGSIDAENEHNQSGILNMIFLGKVLPDCTALWFLFHFQAICRPSLCLETELQRQSLQRWMKARVFCWEEAEVGNFLLSRWQQGTTLSHKYRLVLWCRDCEYIRNFYTFHSCCIAQLSGSDANT